MVPVVSSKFESLYASSDVISVTSGLESALELNAISLVTSNVGGTPGGGILITSSLLAPLCSRNICSYAARRRQLVQKFIKHCNIAVCGSAIESRTTSLLLVLILGNICAFVLVLSCSKSLCIFFNSSNNMGHNSFDTTDSPSISGKSLTSFKNFSGLRVLTNTAI